ncbi:MAG: orotate phosphoribosyltransferase [bacterium]
MSDDFGRLLRESGAIREGHFLLSSGLHSGRYFEKFRILEQPELCARFARLIWERFRDEGVTVVCGPTTGGAIVAYEVARQIGARCVIAEKADSGRKIGRGFLITCSDRVLVVDDVLTTGGSIQETFSALESTGATVVGCGVFVDRSSGVNFPVPFFGVYREEVVNYQPDICPLCRAGIPLETPGRGGKV